MALTRTSELDRWWRRRYSTVMAENIACRPLLRPPSPYGRHWKRIGRSKSRLHIFLINFTLAICVAVSKNRYKKHSRFQHHVLLIQVTVQKCFTFKQQSCSLHHDKNDIISYKYSPLWRGASCSNECEASFWQSHVGLMSTRSVSAGKGLVSGSRDSFRICGKMAHSALACHTL